MEPEAEELIDGDDTDGDELMDVDMSSPKGRKRERAGDNDLVCFPNALGLNLLLIDIICV